MSPGPTVSPGFTMLRLRCDFGGLGGIEFKFPGGRGGLKSTSRGSSLKSSSSSIGGKLGGYMEGLVSATETLPLLVRSRGRPRSTKSKWPWLLGMVEGVAELSEWPTMGAPVTRPVALL